MTGQLTRYDVACRAVAEAHRIDEVKDIRDKAVALSVYARQAKDGELIAHATAIRKRAERRLGELMEDDRKAGKLAKGTRGSKSRERGSPADPRSPIRASTSTSPTGRARQRQCPRRSSRSR